MQRPDPAEYRQSGGYILLEVIVSTAIAASILYLLTTSLSALGRAQDKAARVAESVSSAIFDDAFLRAVIKDIRPDYADGSYRFTGDQTRITGWTWFADGELVAPQRVEFSLVQADIGFQIEMQLGDDTRTVLDVPYGRATFEYVGFDGVAAKEWTAKEQPDAQSPIVRFSQYCHTVPRQVRLVLEDQEGNTVVKSYALSSNEWPMPRPGDAGIFGEF